MEWRNVIFATGIISLCFFAVPIKVNRNTIKQDRKQFNNYVLRFNKPYKTNPQEYDRRFEHFQNSLRQIERLNSLRISNESARYGITEYSDLSEEEFVKKALRPDIPVRSAKHLSSSYYREHRHTSRIRRAIKIPAKFDWRDKGVITRVKNQATCGACWAFSTVEVVESMFAISNGSLLELSVQQMIDCSTNNFGCEGGDICTLLLWLTKSASTVMFSKQYPFLTKTGVCKLDKNSNKKKGLTVTDFTCDSFVDAEDELLQSIATHGPVAVAVNALSWQNYLGGVIQYHCDNSFNNLNHAVQIVGYDTTASTPFYIVRNSWGEAFGDNGYLYISIGNNMCGIVHQASSLDVE